MTHAKSYRGFSSHSGSFHPFMASFWKGYCIRVFEVDGITDTGVFTNSCFRCVDQQAVELCVQARKQATDGFGFREIIDLWTRCLNVLKSHLPTWSCSSDRLSVPDEAFRPNASTRSLIYRQAARKASRAVQRASNIPQTSAFFDMSACGEDGAVELLAISPRPQQKLNRQFE
jgi:hypothetical protein